jgi:hypothetical protein
LLVSGLPEWTSTQPVPLMTLPAGHDVHALDVPLQLTHGASHVLQPVPSIHRSPGHDVQVPLVMSHARHPLPSVQLTQPCPGGVFHCVPTTHSTHVPGMSLLSPCPLSHSSHLPVIVSAVLQLSAKNDPYTTTARPVLAAHPYAPTMISLRPSLLMSPAPLTELPLCSYWRFPVMVKPFLPSSV